MNFSEWTSSLSEELNKLFGKNTFSEDELTGEFYTELMIKCSSWFTTENGCTDLDLFWSDEFRNWLLSDK